jgi:transposase
MKETVTQVFEKHADLKIAYGISQEFKQWYDYGNRTQSTEKITANLHNWYKDAIQISEFESVIEMLRKHETGIINFFRHGLTNAAAERLNGKIKRFASNNYGIKDIDFFMYRTAKYFS